SRYYQNLNSYPTRRSSDLKEKWFLFGPQYEYGTSKPILGTEEYEGEPLVYVNSIRRNSEGATGEGGMTEGEENSGARFHKYRSGDRKSTRLNSSHVSISYA